LGWLSKNDTKRNLVVVVTVELRILLVMLATCSSRHDGVVQCYTEHTNTCNTHTYNTGLITHTCATPTNIQHTTYLEAQHA
jgi:hypothetical protein